MLNLLAHRVQRKSWDKIKVGRRISQIWNVNFRNLHLEMVGEIEVEHRSIPEHFAQVNDVCNHVDEIDPRGITNPWKTRANCTKFSKSCQIRA
jgi:hypothetical protein